MRRLFGRVRRVDPKERRAAARLDGEEWDKLEAAAAALDDKQLDASAAPALHDVARWLRRLSGATAGAVRRSVSGDADMGALHRALASQNEGLEHLTKILQRDEREYCVEWKAMLFKLLKKILIEPLPITRE